MKKLVVLIFLMCTGIAFAQAQKEIVLRKWGSSRKYKFSEGEKIKIKLKESKEVLEGRWWFDQDNTIIVSGQAVELSSFMLKKVSF